MLRRLVVGDPAVLVAVLFLYPVANGEFFTAEPTALSDANDFVITGSMAGNHLPVLFADSMKEG